MQSLSLNRLSSCLCTKCLSSFSLQYSMLALLFCCTVCLLCVDGRLRVCIDSFFCYNVVVGGRSLYLWLTCHPFDDVISLCVHITELYYATTKCESWWYFRGRITNSCFVFVVYVDVARDDVQFLIIFLLSFYYWLLIQRDPMQPVFTLVFASLWNYLQTFFLMFSFRGLFHRHRRARHNSCWFTNNIYPFCV